MTAHDVPAAAREEYGGRWSWLFVPERVRGGQAAARLEGAGRRCRVIAGWELGVSQAVPSAENTTATVAAVAASTIRDYY